MTHPRRRPYALPFALLLAASGPGLAEAQQPATSLEAARARLAPLLHQVEAQHERIITDWVRIAEIPAPSRQEQQRATHVATLFRDAGLEVSRDAIGNVIGLKRGRAGAGKKRIVIAAHLDTVFGPEVDVTVRREGMILHGPGVGDDSSGLVNLVTLARLLAEHDITFSRDVVFLATVQEEIGLFGARAYMEAQRPNVEMFISVDGGYGGVSYGALGIHWYKIHFEGESRHTLSSVGRPSTTDALGRAMARIYQLKVPREPEMKKTWLNLGSIGGGSVINAQAKDAWFTADLRSLDRAELARLEGAVFGIARAAAYEVGVRCRIETIQKFPAAQIKGAREHRLVTSAKAVLESLGVEQPRLSASGASDHCVAVSMGIPGINIGTAKGKGAHSLEESVDATHAPRGIQQTALLLAMLAGLED
jgi:tripeptide aminopeptidase